LPKGVIDNQMQPLFMELCPQWLAHSPSNRNNTMLHMVSMVLGLGDFKTMERFRAA